MDNSARISNVAFISSYTAHAITDLRYLLMGQKNMVIDQKYLDYAI